MRRLIKKKGQVWVETVLYTLIGLAIIGLVLAFAKPGIDRMKSKAVIEQSIESMTNINQKLNEVLPAEGNQRIVELKITEGEIIFDSGENKITWIVDSKFGYGEKDIPISVGIFTVTTKEEKGALKVYIEKEYANINLTGITRLTPAPTPYRLVILNKGYDSGVVEVSLEII